MDAYSHHAAQYYLGSFNQHNKTMLRNKSIRIKKEDKKSLFLNNMIFHIELLR